MVRQEQDILLTGPQGRKQNGKDVEPIKQIPLVSRFLLVAVMTRTLTRMVATPPRRSKAHSCRARRSFAWVSRESSPISSKKSVPPLASSKRPLRMAVAPVNASRLVAEEFAFNEIFRQGGAVDRDKGAFTAFAGRVDGSDRIPRAARPLSSKVPQGKSVHTHDAWPNCCPQSLWAAMAA